MLPSRIGVLVAACLLQVMAMLACAPSPSGEAQLNAVEPARIGSLVDTPITLLGENFFLAAVADLETSAPTEFANNWRVELDGTPIEDALFVDHATISARVPKGLPAGSYKVSLFTPDGTEIVAPDPLEIIDGPLGLPLSIENEPGGTGLPIGEKALGAGETLEAFAVARDTAGNFLIDVEVDWTIEGGIGVIGQGPGTSSTLQATTVGVGVIAATHDLALPATSGDITVTAGAAAAIAVVDAPGPGGVDVADTSLTTDDAPIFFAVSRDAFGNYVGDLDASWTLSAAIGSLSTPSGLSTTLDRTMPGNGVVSADAVGLTTGSTGTLTVAPGRAALLAVSPSTLSLSADAAPVAFSASGTDADGNATTDLGVLGWSVSTGPITAFSNAAAGIFDPAAAGVGTVRVTSSYGASADSGNIEVLPGVAASLTVVPNTLTLSADDAPFVFGVTGLDADGNATSDSGTVTWSVSQGAIDVLGALTGSLDPRTAGTGRITASSSHPGAFGESGDISIEPGLAASLIIAPDTLTVVEGDTPVPFTVSARDADNNITLLTGVLSWIVESGPIAAIATTTGVFTPTGVGLGTIRATSSNGAGVTDVSGDITVLQEATLGVTFAVPAQVSEAQPFSTTMRVTNTGASNANAVAPSALILGGTGSATQTAGPTPATANIAAGAFADFSFDFTAGTAGTLNLSGSASGTDATTANPVSSTTEISADILIQTAPVLSATITMANQIGLGSTFDVTMIVSNSGQADAINLVPDDPLLFAGTANVTELSGPSPASATAVGGGSASFIWSYSADSLGTVQLSGGAVGEDANSGAPVSAASADSNVGNIVNEEILLSSDPFGDSTAFAFVFAYDGQIFLGPGRDGNAAVRMQPDGSGAQSVNFSIPKDTDGNSHSNNQPGPFTSFGITGCAIDTLECGPDNEDGRGHFTSVLMNTGEEWLVAGGARSGGNLGWIYMSVDTDYTDGDLDFRFVDLDDEIGGNTRGFSAVHAFNDRLYLGFPDTGGGQPQLVHLNQTPPAPGFDPPGFPTALKIPVDNIMDDGTDPSMVDAISDLGNRLYIANPMGCFRAINATPLDDEDFIECTPSDSAYSNKVSFQTNKLSEIEPADRAIVAFAAYNSRFYMARNTTAGPQLWSCTPGIAGGTSGQCSPDDWSLVGANGTPIDLGHDTELSQFNNPNNTKISFLAATSTTLYVGFDNLVDGLVLFRTDAANPLSAADFVGQGSCDAGDHPTSCEGVGGNGLGFPPPGPPVNTRIFDGIAVDLDGSESSYLVVGDGATGVQVYRVF